MIQAQTVTEYRVYFRSPNNGAWTLHKSFISRLNAMASARYVAERHRVKIEEVKVDTHGCIVDTRHIVELAPAWQGATRST